MAKERRKRKFRLPSWRVLVLIAVIIYAVFVFIDQQGKIDAAREQEIMLAAEKQQLIKENEFLQAKKDYVSSDEAVSQEVRERLGWIGKDDIIFRPEGK